MSKIINSKLLFERSQINIPGGVNSPVRAFKSVGGTPIFMKSAKGSYLFDEDGNSYVDLINSWGPMILGHAHPDVLAAVIEQVQHSFTYGTPTRKELEMAELMCEMVPNLEMIRMVNSGTEACMSAIRLARGYTGKDKIIKFAGCYHGHHDSFLVQAGSGAMTLGSPNSPGVPKATAANTLIADYNDLDSVRGHFAKYNDIAAIIVEPVAGNMGCILPEEGFLEGLRSICDENNCLLILDEVMTGFRLAPGGAQEKFQVEGDIICYGKIIGGGMPVGAFGGKREIFQHLAPLGSVYQAGTLSGNPVAMAAGIATLSILKNHPEIYSHIAEIVETLGSEIGHILNSRGIDHQINSIGSMISVFFSSEKVYNFSSSASSDGDMFNRLFHFGLENGVYFPPSKYESWFLCKDMSDVEVEKILTVFRKF